jgi:hypothetical protein
VLRKLLMRPGLFARLGFVIDEPRGRPGREWLFFIRS